MSNDIEILPEDFEFHGVGRPPRVSFEDLLDVASEHPGQWVSKVYENKDAYSVQRRAKNYEGVEVATVKVTEDERKVYLKIND